MKHRLSIKHATQKSTVQTGVVQGTVSYMQCGGKCSGCEWLLEVFWSGQDKHEFTHTVIREQYAVHKKEVA